MEQIKTPPPPASSSILFCSLLFFPQSKKKFPFFPQSKKIKNASNSMVTTAAEWQGLCSGYKFDPTDEMVVEHYLLPYLRGEEFSLAGVVFVDDPRRLPPWLLLEHHGRGGDGDRDRVRFIAPAAAVGQDGRQSRSVAGGGRWVKQKKEEGEGTVVVGGEMFRWEKSVLSFHHDAHRNGGATGWVMHEIAVVPPPGSAVAATHRACRIAFTGHGHKRKRVPDGYVIDVAVKKEVVDQEQSNRDQEQSNKQLLPALEQNNQERVDIEPAPEQKLEKQSNQDSESKQLLDQEQSNQDQEQSNQQLQQSDEAEAVVHAVKKEDPDLLPAPEQKLQKQSNQDSDSKQFLDQEQSNQDQEDADIEQNQGEIAPEKKKQSNQEENQQGCCNQEEVDGRFDERNATALKIEDSIVGGQGC